MSENLFGDSDEEVSGELPTFVVDHSDNYIVMVRFRSLKDHNDFAKLIGQPDLKKFIKNGNSKTVYPTPYNPMEEMFG